MYCLYCGNCCKNMSPISQPEPCPKLINDEGFYFCDSYKYRPIECKNHEYPSSFCPIGIDVLKLKNLDEVRDRIDNGWNKIKLKYGESYD